ncbi:MAG: KGGVGR-motif variant AAA ATPase [Thermoanaerobaculia bacterium]
MPPAQGRIVTFYSYKGGTGRSMALANVAWILASNAKRVLVIDWDLEAPGLHRYFRPYVPDKDLATSPGLMEFLLEYVSQALTPSDEAKPLDWYKAHADIVEYAQSLRWSLFEKPGTLDLIPAGRQCESYASTVNLFNWQQFYDKLGGNAFFEAAKDYMRSEYDYILIDSRTGVSDTSGICTIHMPDTVVLCFTLNIQSIEGAAAVAARIEHARQNSNRDIRILPVPTRVDESEKEKVELARIDAWHKFDRFLWQMSPEERADYWGTIEHPYRAWYSFEEVLATFGDRPRLQSSLLSAMETLTSFITKGEVTRLNPISETERLAELAKFVRRRASEPAPAGVDAAVRSEQALQRLTPALQERALAVLVRLANVTADDTLFATRRLDRQQLGEIPDRVMQTLRYAELITETKLPDGSEVVELSNPEVLRDWTRARRALESDRPFLMWRQKLADDAVAWRRTRDSRHLVNRGRMKEARIHFEQRPSDFNDMERDLIAASGQRHRNVAVAAIMAFVIPLLAVLGVGSWRRTDSYQIGRVFTDAVVSSDDATDTADQATEIWIGALVDAGGTHIVEARNVVAASRTGAQRAGRAAALASALYQAKLPSESDTAVTDATAALAKISAGNQRTRAKIHVADLLTASYPEKATLLLFESLQAALYESDASSYGTLEPSESGASLVSLVARKGPSENAEAIRLDLFRDLIMTMQKLRLSRDAARVLRDDADVALREVGSREGVAWLLDLVGAFEGDPNADSVSQEARKKVLATLLRIEPGAARERDLTAAIQAVTNTGRGSELVVQTLRDPRFTRNEVYSGALIAFRALARWRTAADDSSVWTDGVQLARTLESEQRNLVNAAIAAALAAAGETEAATRIADEIVARNASSTATPARQAAVLAAVSEIHCRAGLDAEARTFRQRAVQQALVDPDIRSQSETIAAAALVAARCGDVAAATRTSQAAADPAVVQQALPELVMTMAEAAGTENPAGALASAKRIAVAASQIETREIRDEALMSAVVSLIGAARARAAIEVAKTIEDPMLRARAAEKIAVRMQDTPMDELRQLADSIEADYPRTRARVAVAKVYRARNQRSEVRRVLQEAERGARGIGDATERSDALRDIAIEYANVADLRSARSAALACADASDRLRAFAAIVLEWNRQQAQAIADAKKQG